LPHALSWHPGRDGVERFDALGLGGDIGGGDGLLRLGDQSYEIGRCDFVRQCSRDAFLKGAHAGLHAFVNSWHIAKFHRHARPVAIAQKSVFIESVVINVDHCAIIQSS
jgi:hypothetical protein